MIHLIKRIFGQNNYESIFTLTQTEAQDKFQKMLKNPDKLYREMIIHEEKYHSFTYNGKANLATPTKGEIFMRDIFTRDKSQELVKLAAEIDKKAIERSEEPPYLLREAILQK